jgi:hypothetical protein
VGNNGAASLKTLTVWMGGLFNPEAFVTATRQCVAQVSYASSFNINWDVVTRRACFLKRLLVRKIKKFLTNLHN